MPKTKEFEPVEEVLIIEKAKPRDLGQIVRLNKLLHFNLPNFGEEDQYDRRDWVSEEIREGNFFVLKRGGNIRGAMCINISGKVLTIETLAVDKMRQGKGNGRKLVEFAIDAAIEKGLKSVKVGSFTFLEVRDFYLKCGFEPDILPFWFEKGKKYYRFIKKTSSKNLKSRS